MNLRASRTILPLAGEELLAVAIRIMRTILLVLVLAVVSTAIAGERTAELQLKEYLTDESYTGSVFAQGKLDGIDYRKLLRGAIRRDSASLAGIFRYTANGKLMGEGAESNCDILRQLLRFWGDRAFARVLAAESLKVRIAVIAAIDYAWPHPGWQPTDFPLTFRLARHDTRYRQ